jgi:hypothetical protein
LAKAQKDLLIKIGHLFHIYYDMQLTMAQKGQNQLDEQKAGIAVGKQTAQKEASAYT